MNAKTTDWPMVVAAPAAIAWALVLGWLGNPVLPVLVLTVKVVAA